jgi:hypothetical protein
MTEGSTTYVVECYLPGVDDAAVHRAADDVAAAVQALGGTETGIEYLGALLMAVDEVVLHAFRATDRALVSAASVGAHLQFERVIESVEVLPMPLIQPNGQAAAAPIPLLQPKEVPS